MKSSFLPEYKQKIVRIYALTTQGRNPDNFSFVCILEETMNSYIHSENNWPLASKPASMYYSWVITIMKI